MKEQLKSFKEKSDNVLSEVDDLKDLFAQLFDMKFHDQLKA